MTDPVLPTGGSAADTANAVDPNVAANAPVLKVPDQASEPGKDGQANKPASVAPEKYELQLPEGFEVDAKRMEAFQGWGRQNNLTNENLQAVFDLYKAEVEHSLQSNQSAFEQQVETWMSSAETDKEIGNANWDQTKVLANKAVDVFGSKEVREALNTAGLGAHPAVLRMLRKIGAALQEDKTQPGSTNNVAQKSAAERMFPNQKPN